MKIQESTSSVASQAVSDGEFAKMIFASDGNTPVREAILRDLLDAADSTTFPIQLTQHPYRPGISADLERRFSVADWAATPKPNLDRLASND
jgi:hypothetical protein